MDKQQRSDKIETAAREATRQYRRGGLVYELCIRRLEQAIEVPKVSEGDLLGEALASIGHLVWLIEKQFKHDGMHITKDAKALLAKAKGKKP